MKRAVPFLFLVVALVVGSVTGLVFAPAASAHQQSVAGPANLMPSSVPSAITPSFDDGAVYGIAESGTTMIVGGNFTSVNGSSHPYLLAFDAQSGAIVSGFHPTLDGYVNTVVAGPTADTVFVGGVFTHVNGAVMPYLALLDITTGQAVSGFQPPTLDNYVNDVVVHGTTVYVAGVFTQAGTSPHGGVLALDAGTGAVLSSFNIQLTGHHNQSGSGAQGQTGARDIDVTASGTTMVVVGNFSAADGVQRDQIALIDLSGPNAQVAPWATDAFVPLCNSFAIDSYMRGVAFSPDGSYFVTTTKGGGHRGTSCDAASRFDTNLSDANAHPVWVDESGGDTLYGIAITGSAIFLGGHNRWMNNPLAVGTARQGAVPRAGLEALDPVSGRVLAWNPGRLPLGVAVFAILATPQGVWIGSDTDYIGDYAYKRPKLAMFPWSGGYQLASTSVAGLPGRAFLGAGTTVKNASLATVAYDGSTAAKTTAGTQGIDFNRWRGAFLIGNKVFYGYSADSYLYSRTFDGTTFGPAVKIDPYHDPAWDNVQTGDGDTFRGALPAFYQSIRTLTGMVYDKGRVYYTLSGDARLYAAWFSPDSGVIDQTIITVPSSVDLSQADGLFVAGGNLYFASKADGALRRVAFDPATGITGSAAVVSGPGVDGVNWLNNALFLAAPSGVVNQPPTASFTSSCTQLTCGFRSSSTDPDGTIVSATWNYGDGSSGAGHSPAHIYSAPGQYTVTLSVTDNGGATNSTSSQVTVSGTAPNNAIGFVAAATSAGGSSTTKTVTVPAAAQPGQVALLSLASPSGASWSQPVGWTQLATSTVGSLVTTVWTKTLAAGDPGSAVSLSNAASTHAALTVAVYSGVDQTTPVRLQSATGDTNSTSHQTPGVTANLGEWVVSIWSDRSTATRTYTPPSSVQVRSASSDSGGLTVQSLVADSNGPVAQGLNGRITAVSDAAATTSEWTILLQPAP